MKRLDVLLAHYEKKGTEFCTVVSSSPELQHVGVLDDDGEGESKDDARQDCVDDKARQTPMRKGMNLATTLACIGKNFVITVPRLPDNPILRLLIFASDSFLELTEYSREEISGRSCRHVWYGSDLCDTEVTPFGVKYKWDVVGEKPARSTIDSQGR
ncbi:hypothetical protein RJ640_025481 [Escallonia rubra]|uniref:LOV domain-containing protein n=1 Tax=Escallonia rubra TaxID=112253 RepID=A0AA88UG97_9ASTE|nr:hypothetical protein RJ640_025481 [Escallonia rubra]